MRFLSKIIRTEVIKLGKWRMYKKCKARNTRITSSTKRIEKRKIHTGERRLTGEYLSFRKKEWSFRKKEWSFRKKEWKDILNSGYPSGQPTMLRLTHSSLWERWRAICTRKEAYSTRKQGVYLQVLDDLLLE